MKFGIDHLFTVRGDRTEQEVLQDSIRQTVLAEELGFDGCWIAEHHFSTYGIVGNLSTMAAALAQATERIRIGLAVAVLPLASPLRLAEELALVDVLSGGRLDIGVGRGYQPDEFRRFGIPFEEASARFDETLEILQLCWRDEPFSFDGKFFQLEDIEIFPKPLQKPHPPIMKAALSSHTFGQAGKSGMRILTSPNFTPIELVKENLGTYRTSLQDAGFNLNDFDYPMLQQVYVCEDPEEAIEFPRPYALYFYERLARLLPSIDDLDIPSDYSEYGKMQRNVDRVKYEYLLEHGINVGTPEQVAERIHTLEQEAGVNYYIGWFNFGGMPPEKVEQSMKLFADKVMPQFSR